MNNNELSLYMLKFIREEGLKVYLPEEGVFNSEDLNKALISTLVSNGMYSDIMFNLKIIGCNNSSLFFYYFKNFLNHLNHM